MELKLQDGKPVILGLRGMDLNQLLRICANTGYRFLILW